MKKILESMCNTTKLVSVCADLEDQDVFSVGYVVFTNEEYCLIDGLNTEGFRDGIKVRKITDIIVIEEGGAYEKNILELATKCVDKNKNKPLFVPEFENLTELLTKLSERQVKIDLFYGKPEYKYTGFVKSIDNGIIILDKIDEEGHHDGVVYLIVGNIQGADYSFKETK